MQGPIQNVHVEGVGNQVIVAGGDVHYTVVYQLPRASVDEQRELLGLLGLVRRQWLVSVLDQAVKGAALLEPGMHSEPRMAVERPWTREQAAVGTAPEKLPPGTSIAEVFENAGRTLLLLGGPGAGKTIALLTLARAWADRAEHDPFAPVPVVFNLSTWGTSRRSIHDWVVAELADHYGADKPQAERWLKERRLLLLLDGLDEVVAERRAACVEAIHAFVLEFGVPGMAVASRRQEYAALPVRLSVGAAVTLLPLTPAQVDGYLAAAGGGLSGLRAVVDGNAELREIATSPLMLNLMSVAFRGLPAGALVFGETSNRAELHEEIFARFVDRVFTRRDRAEDGFPRAWVEDGLRWLASGMTTRGRIFAIELLQPAWLTPRQLVLYTVASRVGAATAVAGTIGLVLYLAAVLTVRITRATVGEGRPLAWVTAAATLATVLAMGVATGLLYAPLAYRTLRHSSGEPRRWEMARELGVTLGYLALSSVAALLVVGIGRWRFGLSIDDPKFSVALLTLAFSALSLPTIFGRKPGRGIADRDISLAGTLSWQWKTAGQAVAVSAVVGGVMIRFAPSFGIDRPLAVFFLVIVTFLTMMGAWRQDLPPVDRWKDGKGSSALRASGKAFAYLGLCCAAVLFPVLALAMGTDHGLGDPLDLAVFAGLLLFAPALLWFGGVDLVLHTALRLVLSLTGPTPLRLRRFLDYTVHLGFLQRAGGGYIFFHGLLLEHFATRPPARAVATPPSPD